MATTVYRLDAPAMFPPWLVLASAAINHQILETVTSWPRAKRRWFDRRLNHLRLVVTDDTHVEVSIDDVILLASSRAQLLAAHNRLTAEKGH